MIHMTAAEYKRAVLLALRALVVAQPHGFWKNIESAAASQEALNAISEALSEGGKKE